jgi:serine/threonine protein kinase
LSIEDAKRAYKEIKILKHVKNHENIISLKDLFTRADNLDDFEDM